MYVCPWGTSPPLWHYIVMWVTVGGARNLRWVSILVLGPRFAHQLSSEVRVTLSLSVHPLSSSDSSFVINPWHRGNVWCNKCLKSPICSVFFRDKITRKGQGAAVNVRQEEVTAYLAAKSWCTEHQFYGAALLCWCCQICSPGSVQTTNFIPRILLQLAENLSDSFKKGNLNALWV